MNTYQLKENKFDDEPIYLTHEKQYTQEQFQDFIKLARFDMEHFQSYLQLPRY